MADSKTLAGLISAFLSYEAYGPEQAPQDNRR